MANQKTIAELPSLFVLQDSLVFPIDNGIETFKTDFEHLAEFIASKFADKFELPGTIKAYGGPTPPEGWLICNGAAVSRATYAALFTAIGVTWGNGDGSTTFNLPDLRGRFPIGAGEGPGLSNRNLGAWGGAEAIQLTVAQLPSHTHTVSGSAASSGAHTHTVSGSAASSGAHTHTVTISTSGAHGHARVRVFTAPKGTGGSNEHFPSNSGTLTTYPNAFIPNDGSEGTHSHSGSAASSGAHTHTVSGSAASSGAHTHTVSGSAAATGSGETHDNMPPWAGVHFIIRT